MFGLSAGGDLFHRAPQKIPRALKDDGLEVARVPTIVDAQCHVGIYNA